MTAPGYESTFDVDPIDDTLTTSTLDRPAKTLLMGQLPLGGSTVVATW